MRSIYAITLVFCFSFHALAFAQSNDDDFGSAANDEWSKTEKAISSDYAAHEKNELQSWHDYQERVKQKWSDGAIPEEKRYVQYFDHDTSRIRIDYENGTVTAEALLDPSEKSNDAAKKKIQTALSSMVTGGNSPDSLLTKDEISSSAIATSMVNQESTKASDGKSRILYRITLKMVPDYIKKRAEKIMPIVKVWTDKYHLDPAFVLAIIRTESSFNPRAHSAVGAVGLMQVMPRFAGKEVLQAVTGKTTIPSEDFLYEGSKNIMVGTTYLQLIRDKYFPDIKDKTKQMYVSSAAYNWGPHRLQKLISQGRIPSSANSEDTFGLIQKYAPLETKGYVQKVTQYFNEFKKEGL